ncbi:MAG: DUF4105 domain-containing protein [Candidatus Paceibacterota bacterium]|jgi:hypothetical protein
MKKKLILGLCILPFALYGLFVTTFRPDNDRDWSVDQAILPSAEFNGDLVTVRNIRNFSYASTTSYTPAYYDKTFNLNDIESLWYVVEPFSKGGNLAHTFLSFGFKGDHYVSISVEIRKEKGESFSPLKGLFRQYEIMYVVADEKDVIKLRTNYRNDKVFLYPIRATTQATRDIFVDMLNRANALTTKPEFYNTLTNTCTTNIMTHVNKVIPHEIPFNITILVPGQSDHFAYDLGLINTDLTFAEARKRFQINDRAMKYANDPEFSKIIRE